MLYKCYSDESEADRYDLVFQRGSEPEQGRELVASWTQFENAPSRRVPLWHDFRREIDSVTFKDVVSPLSTARWFEEMRCRSFDLANLDTSRVTDMSGMFFYCSLIESLDLSGFDTSNVANMSEMFYWCGSLKNLDLSSFDTSKVTDMSRMFFRCSCMWSINLSSFDTSSVRNMSGMFEETYLEDVLDLSSFDTSNVTDMSGMFCETNTNHEVFVDLSGFDTSNVTDMSEMFCYSQIDCTGLSSFDTSNVTDMSGMFCFTGVLGSDEDLSGWNTSNVTDMSEMFEHRIVESLDLSSFDVSHVTNMSGMFSESEITTINLSGFDFSHVENMSGMFKDCESDEVSLAGLDLSRVENMSSMFEGARIGTLILDGCDTSHVTDMSSMFSRAAIDNFDTSVLDFSNVRNLSHMFSRSLFSSLDLPNLDAPRAVDLSNMFSYSYALESVNLPSLTASNVKDLSCMFAYCTSLKSLSLPVLSPPWDANLDFAFYDCAALESLDLSACSIRQQNGKGAAFLFAGCCNLATVSVGAPCSLVAYLRAPSALYIPGAAGTWLNSGGHEFSSREIPENIPDVYTAALGGQMNPPSVFSDVDYNGETEQGWAATWIDKVSALGFMTGDRDPATQELTGCFIPEGTLTRAQAITILYRMFTRAADDEEAGQDDTSFVDVAESAYYTNALNWAYKRGIVHGYNDAGREFGPDNTVLRGELATMLWNACGRLDVEDTSAYDMASDTWGVRSGDALAWTASLDIISGYVLYSPQGNRVIAMGANDPVLRCQAAKIFVQASKFIE